MMMMMMMILLLFIKYLHKIYLFIKYSEPNQYLVKTGAFINDIQLCKKGWVLPGQKSMFFDITPANYTLQLQAMTAEKLEFNLPAVAGSGENPAEINAVCGFVPAEDGVVLLKSMTAEELAIAVSSLTAATQGVVEIEPVSAVINQKVSEAIDKGLANS